MNDFESFRRTVQREKRFIIYGAQHHAQCMHIALKILLPDIKNLFFMVSNKKKIRKVSKGLPCGRLTTGRKDTGRFRFW